MKAGRKLVCVLSLGWIGLAIHVASGSEDKTTRDAKRVSAPVTATKRIAAPKPDLAQMLSVNVAPAAPVIPGLDGKDFNGMVHPVNPPRGVGPSGSVKLPATPLIYPVNPPRLAERIRPRKASER